MPLALPCRSRAQPPRRQVQKQRGRSPFSSRLPEGHRVPPFMEEAAGEFPVDAAEAMAEECGVDAAGPVVVACGGDSEG